MPCAYSAKKKMQNRKDQKLRSLERNELLKTVKRLEERFEKWSGYHRREV